MVLAVFFVMHSSVGVFTKIERDFWGNKEMLADKVDALTNIRSEQSILYLDAGEAPYLFEVNSSCRYLSPLPIQRDRPDWNLSALAAYQEAYSCVMNYTGEYIVADGNGGWFGYDNPRKKPILDKLNREYQIVWNKSWVVYKLKY